MNHELNTEILLEILSAININNVIALSTSNLDPDNKKSIMESLAIKVDTYEKLHDQFKLTVQPK